METISAIIFDSFVVYLTFNGAARFERRNEKRSRCRSMHRVYSAANDRRRDGDKQRYRWKRGNWMAAVVLTNDLTPVWTVAFDEIRIISVGACQCKCHTYIQLPLVTLRSTTGHSKPSTPLFHEYRFFARTFNFADLSLNRKIWIGETHARNVRWSRFEYHDALNDKANSFKYSFIGTILLNLKVCTYFANLSLIWSISLN